MPPPFGIDNIQRSMSMPDLERLYNLDNLSGPGNIDNQENQIQPENPGDAGGLQVQPDHAIEAVQDNGAGPDIQRGNGQVENFVANHKVSSGRDWDTHTAEGMLDIVRNSTEHVKKHIIGREGLDALDRKVGEIVASAANAHPEAAEELANEFAGFKRILGALRSAREKLVCNLDLAENVEDPRKAIEHIQKQMRVFRWDLQLNMQRHGMAGGEMGGMEDFLRGLQNMFTKVVIGGPVSRVLALERALDDKLGAISNRLRELDRTTHPLVLPQEAKFAAGAAKAVEISHRTNDRVRDFWDEDRTSSVLRGMVGPLVKNGGSRKVEFSVGVGALIGLGFSSAATAGIRAGARIKLTAEIDAPGKDQPISVTFRITGGLEGKLIAEAGKESSVAGAKGQLTAGGGVSHFTTRKYATLADLIADANNCKLATSRTVGGAIAGYAKALGVSIGKLGQKLFRWMGRRAGEVKQDAAAYLKSMKQMKVFGKLDHFLSKRLNPVIVAVRKGWSWFGSGEAKAGIAVGAGPLKSDLGVGASISGEREFGVDNKEFTPLAHLARAAKNAEALQSMMRPEPEGGQVPELAVPVTEGKSVMESLEAKYDEIVQAAEDAKSRSSLIFKDKVGFANAANGLRTLMLSTELAARKGMISRDDADRLLSRFSNLPVRIPDDIFREYMMDQTGDASPQKIRFSCSAKFKVGMFSGWSKGLTGDISNSVLKAVANGGVHELRHQTGLDTEVEYVFTRETPVEKTDPRPWENITRTTHTLSITGSAPVRILLDNIVKSIANKGERVENQKPIDWKSITKESLVDAAKDAPMGALYASLPGLVLGIVKESALAAVKKWLENPENVVKLVMFAIEHIGDALEILGGALEWVVEHPEATLQIAASIAGTDSLGEASRNKVVQWTCVNGEFESVSLSMQSTSKIGVTVDPVGVGLGVGFDLSYSVSSKIKEIEYGPRRPLLSFLAKAEQFIAGESGAGKTGGEAFKNWIARNLRGVENVMKSLKNPATAAKQAKIYADAMERVADEDDLRNTLQDAWHEATSLPDDAAPDKLASAAYKLFVSLVRAYKYAPEQAA